MAAFLLDANALLNATFLPLSWSRAVVVEARQRQIALFTGRTTADEALHRARSIARKHGLRHDPIDQMNLAAERFALQAAPAGTDVTVPPQWPRHDRHVYQEAVAADAIIITSDYELCLAAPDRAKFPHEILAGWNDPRAHPLQGVQPLGNAGSIFFRGTFAWTPDSPVPDHVDVVEITAPNVPIAALSIFYDGPSRSWRTTLAGSDVLSVKSEFTGEEVIIGLSWTFPGRIQLRIGSEDHPAEREMAGPMPDFSQEHNIAIGGTRAAGGVTWSFWLSAFVLNDRPIGKELWKLLRKSSRLTPNPYDHDRLEARLLHLLR